MKPSIDISGVNDLYHVLEPNLNVELLNIILNHIGDPITGGGQSYLSKLYHHIDRLFERHHLKDLKYRLVIENDKLIMVGIRPIDKLAIEGILYGKENRYD